MSKMSDKIYDRNLRISQIHHKKKLSLNPVKKFRCCKYIFLFLYNHIKTGQNSGKNSGQFLKLTLLNTYLCKKILDIVLLETGG